MADIQPGRFTAQVDEPLVLFLIGMRINRPWKVWKWLPVARAMPRMLRRMASEPSLGLLHFQNGSMSFNPLVVCYFRSHEDLYRFASDPDEPHLEPWRRFNARVRASGDVGIWHETYTVTPDSVESIYGNMPPWGLSAATGRVPVGRRGQSARKRAGLTDADEPIVTPY